MCANASSPLSQGGFWERVAAVSRRVRAPHTFQFRSSGAPPSSGSTTYV